MSKTVRGGAGQPMFTNNSIYILPLLYMCCISSFGPVGKKKQKQEQLSFALTADEKRNNCGRTESFVDTHKQIKKNSIFYRFENEKKKYF